MCITSFRSLQDVLFCFGSVVQQSVALLHGLFKTSFFTNTFQRSNLDLWLTHSLPLMKTRLLFSQHHQKTAKLTQNFDWCCEYFHHFRTLESHSLQKTNCNAQPRTSNRLAWSRDILEKALAQGKSGLIQKRGSSVLLRKFSSK